MDKALTKNVSGLSHSTRKGRDRVTIVKMPGLMGISVQANA